MREIKFSLKPLTTLGKWSIMLESFFVVVILISNSLVNAFGILNFDDHWWDVTIAVALLANITALITGLRAMVKGKERSVLVLLAIILEIAVILFILSHSLFIKE